MDVLRLRSSPAPDCLYKLHLGLGIWAFKREIAFCWIFFWSYVRFGVWRLLFCQTSSKHWSKDVCSLSFMLGAKLFNKNLIHLKTFYQNWSKDVKISCSRIKKISCHLWGPFGWEHSQWVSILAYLVYCSKSVTFENALMMILHSETHLKLECRLKLSLKLEAFEQNISWQEVGRGTCEWLKTKSISVWWVIISNLNIEPCHLTCAVWYNQV